MSRRSTSRSDKLQRSYLTALREYLAKTPGTTLETAEELGHQAVIAELTGSQLATLHKEALPGLIPAGENSRSLNVKLSRASRFFAAALKPMDRIHGKTMAENERLSRLQEKLGSTKLELEECKRKLKDAQARRRKLEEALKESKQEAEHMTRSSLEAQQELRNLSHQVLSVQEEERKRISRELHDEVGQTLTAINLKLATVTAQSKINARLVKQTIRSTQSLVEQSMETVHRFARDLRPPVLDDLGLIPALKAHLDEFKDATGIPVRFRVFAAVEEMDSDKRAVLYRVTQEAITNIAAHAQASLVIVDIQRKAGSVRMEIRDNGRGFDVKSTLSAKRIARLGLLGMRERLEMVGGSFEIQSQRLEGTTIRAQIPFHGPERARPERSRDLST